MNPRPRASMLTLALLAFPALAVEVQAQSVYRRSFLLPSIKRSNLDVWNGLPSRSFGSVFIGPTWTIPTRTVDGYGELTIGGGTIAGIYVPPLKIGKTGFQLKYAGSGQVGFDLTPSFSGGVMTDLDYIGGVTISNLPSAPEATKPYTVTLSYGASRSSRFNVASPGIGLGVDGKFRVDGNASASAWFLGKTLVDDGELVKIPKSGYTGPLSFSQSLVTPQELTQASVGVFNKALNLANFFNPTGVSGQWSVPDLAVEGDTVGSGGSVTGSRFSTFFTANTDLMSWALSVVPPAKGFIANNLLSNSTTVPGTGVTVGWDFAKLYANMNVGLRSDYTVKPAAAPELGLIVTYVNATGNVVNVDVRKSGNDFTFTMPNYPVRLQPTVKFDLQLESKLGIGLTGEIGTSPARFTLDGTIGGTSDRAQTYHLDVDPAHYDWKIDPETTSNRKTIRNTIASVDQTFNGLTLSLANLTDFSPFLVPLGQDPNGVTGEVPLNVVAYGLKGDTVEPYYTATFLPIGNYTLLSGTAGANANGTVIPVNGKDTDSLFDPVGPDNLPVKLINSGRGRLEISFRSRDLAPGQYTLLTNLFNDAGKKATYRIPMNVNYAPGQWDGTFFGDEARVKTLNRLRADREVTTRVYAKARYLYSDTEVVMNGSVVLPHVGGSNNPQTLNDGEDFYFDVPPAVARRFAGRANTIQLRTRDVSGDGMGYVYSPIDPLDPHAHDLFIVAGAPAVSGIEYEGQTNASLPLTTEPVTFKVNGTNFSEATRLYLKTSDLATGQVTESEIDADYSTSNSLRATLSASQMALLSAGSPTGGALRVQIYASTPRVDVPADYSYSATTSGGTSSLVTLAVAHRKPTVTRTEPSILVKDGGAQTVRIYGDNLVVPGTVDYSAFYTALQSGTVKYPSTTPGASVPYIDVTYAANSPFVTAPGDHAFTVSYSDAKSEAGLVSTEYAAPKIGSVSRVIMRGPEGTLTITGGPFYKDATELAFGPGPLACTVTSPTTLIARVPASYQGTSALVRVITPGPGGGSSNLDIATLVEGDEKTFTVAPGPLVFDRATGNYKQSFAVTYNGSRDVSAGIRLQFDEPSSGGKLVNANGTIDGKPYLTVMPTAGRTVNVVAIWSKPASGTISAKSLVKFPY